jgi:hypothetical protein
MAAPSDLEMENGYSGAVQYICGILRNFQCKLDDSRGLEIVEN